MGPSEDVGVLEGRGDWVTAITAIFNFSDAPFTLRHLKYPRYDTLVPSGFFRYPTGMTAPINWGSSANGLIEFGALGTMWQSHKYVYYKAGGKPAHDTDGEVVYTRQDAFPGEQYLVLGIDNNRVRTLKSSTALEAIFENLGDAALNVLTRLRPTDYAHIAKDADIMRSFISRLKAAGDSGRFQDASPVEVEALSRTRYQDIQNAVAKLTPEEKNEIFNIRDDDLPGLVRAQRFFSELGIYFATKSIVLFAMALLCWFLAATLLPTVAGPTAFFILGCALTIFAIVGIFVAIFCKIISLILELVEKLPPSGFFEHGGALTVAG